VGRRGFRVAASTEVNSAKALVQVQRTVSFGQSVKIVGGHPILGDWNPADGVALEWSEGDVWKAEVDLPPGTWEFKVVVVGGASDEWEGGNNRVIEVPEDSLGVLGLSMDWGVEEMLVEDDVVVEAPAAEAHAQEPTEEEAEAPKEEEEALAPAAVASSAVADPTSEVAAAPEASVPEAEEGEETTKQPSGAAVAGVSLLVGALSIALLLFSGVEVPGLSEQAANSLSSVAAALNPGSTVTTT